MTEDVCIDPASTVIDAFTTALAEAFAADSECPPDAGGSADVRFFGGDGIPMAAWNAHATGSGCDAPFLWVRVTSRYRTQSFPSVAVDVNSCGLPKVIAIEIGVGRCADTEMDPDWDDYAAQAEVSLDDSWRIELALCRAASLLRSEGYTCGSGEILPYGPEGGVMAWTGVAYVQY